MLDPPLCMKAHLDKGNARKPQLSCSQGTVKIFQRLMANYKNPFISRES